MIQDYAHDRNNTVRYTLGKYVTKPLIFFGINPSTASIEKNDATISIIEHIAKLRHYDGYMMLNIYPLRATKIDSAFPKKCDVDICAKNLHYIEKTIYKSAEVVAAWGSHIRDRDYFIDILDQINRLLKEKDATWLCLSVTKGGHPHHPTRLAYNKMTFDFFDMDTYIQNMRNTK